MNESDCQQLHQAILGRAALHRLSSYTDWLQIQSPELSYWFERDLAFMLFHVMRIRLNTSWWFAPAALANRGRRIGLCSGPGKTGFFNVRMHNAEEKVDNRESKIGQIKTTRYLAKFKINLNFLSFVFLS